MICFLSYKCKKCANISYILYENIEGKAILKSKEMLSTKFKIIAIPGSSGGRGIQLEITSLGAS